MLRQFLNQAGYEVLGAPDGRHALELLEAGLEPDLLVLDLMMPVMTGFEVLGALRSNPGWADLPVVVLTATPGFSADHLQVDAVLLKPFDFVDVQAAIHLAQASQRKRKSTTGAQ